MKLLAPLGALLLLAAALPAATAADATVTLEITYGYHALPAAATCSVTVPDGASVGDVLDAAVKAGCIRSWSGVDYGAPGDPDRFVTCVDAGVQLCNQDASLDGTFWAFYFDGALADAGVDHTFVHAGDVAQLAYGDYYVPFTLP